MLPSLRSPRFSYLTSFGFFGVLILALVCVSPGRAVDGRDFAGFYEVSNVSDLGDTVEFTLTVRIFNYSDADANGAVVSLEDSVELGNIYGSFPGAVTLPNRASVRISSDFIVSKAEYERWQAGWTPAMWIAYTDANGDAVHRKAALEYMPIGEEN